MQIRASSGWNNYLLFTLCIAWLGEQLGLQGFWLDRWGNSIFECSSRICDDGCWGRQWGRPRGHTCTSSLSLCLLSWRCPSRLLQPSASRKQSTGTTHVPHPRSSNLHWLGMRTLVHLMVMKLVEEQVLRTEHMTLKMLTCAGCTITLKIFLLPELWSFL